MKGLSPLLAIVILLVIFLVAHYQLGIMGIITSFADAASPIYANSGYLPSKNYWRLGTIFGAIYLVLFLAIRVPRASLLWGK
jgi:L-tartrate/succinate antiporter